MFESFAQEHLYDGDHTHEPTHQGQEKPNVGHQRVVPLYNKQARERWEDPQTRVGRDDTPRVHRTHLECHVCVCVRAIWYSLSLSLSPTTPRHGVTRHVSPIMFVKHLARRVGTEPSIDAMFPVIKARVS